MGDVPGHAYESYNQRVRSRLTNMGWMILDDRQSIVLKAALKSFMTGSEVTVFLKQINPQLFRYEASEHILLSFRLGKGLV